jgi:hypothetical protein
MADPDYEFTEGFDKYGNINNELSQALNVALWADEWNSISVGGGSLVRMEAALNGVIAGHASARFAASGSGNSQAVLIKNLPANYARVVGGFTTKIADGFSVGGITFYDGVTAQCSVALNNATGHVEIRRGVLNGTLLGATTESYATGNIKVIEYDITFHGSTGKAKLWIDGIPTSVALVAQNTISSANAYTNKIQFGVLGSNGHVFLADHLYHWFYTAAGGVEPPALSNPIIETTVASGDDTTNFIVNGHAFPTPNYYWGNNISAYAGGANILYLRRIVVDQAGAISNLVIPKVNTTSATVKTKAVIYADAAGIPSGAPLATGAEVVGTTIGTALVLPLALAGEAAGNIRWVGFIIDTNISFGANDDGGTSYAKVNTYTSGPPNPVGVGFGTNNGNVNMIVTMTGVATHFPQVNQLPSLGDYGYNYSATVTDKDLFTFPALTTVPVTIHGVALKARLGRSDTGVRGAKLVTKSGATSSYGSGVQVSPPTNYGMESSYWRYDPNTAGAWTAANVNAAKGGVEVTL